MHAYVECKATNATWQDGQRDDKREEEIEKGWLWIVELIDWNLTCTYHNKKDKRGSVNYINRMNSHSYNNMRRNRNRKSSNGMITNDWFKFNRNKNSNIMNRNRRMNKSNNKSETTG